MRANPARSKDLIEQAEAHVATARLVADSDRPAAVSCCHDAIRKAIDAHAGARGYRFENKPGAHRTTLAYAEHELADVITTADVDLADTLRRRRHGAEYGEFPASSITASELTTYIQLASRVATAIAKTLPGLSTGRLPDRPPS